MTVTELPLSPPVYNSFVVVATFPQSHRPHNSFVVIPRLRLKLKHRKILTLTHMSIHNCYFTAPHLIIPHNLVIRYNSSFEPQKPAGPILYQIVRFSSALHIPASALRAQVRVGIWLTVGITVGIAA